MGQMMTLRDRWARGVAWVWDLLRRNEVAAELRDEARLVLEEGPRP